jgi:cobalt/nickel transport protein
MRTIPGLFAATLAGLVPAAPAAAHFLTIYTPETMLEDDSRPLLVDVIFWHPLFTGEVLDMVKPREFQVTHSVRDRSLLDRLSPITFRTWSDTGAAFTAEVPLSGEGDYVLSVVPEPYWDEDEQIYIQQIAKTYINVGHEVTEWYRPVGLPAEIVPINRPYDVYVGSTFTGVVLSNDEPVAGAEIEVEYIAALPDVRTHTTGQPDVTGTKMESIITYSDANGYFTFGLPRAGWWGFAALGVGPEFRFNGKQLSQDAVLWVQAREFGK